MWIAKLDVYVDCERDVYEDDAALKSALDAQLERNIENRPIQYEAIELRGPGGGNPYVKFASKDGNALFDFVVSYWGPEQAFLIKEIK